MSWSGSDVALGMNVGVRPRRLAVLPLLLAVAALAGCGGLQMELPEGFLRLQRAPHDQLKATTPDDARLWVREFDDPDEGTLEFWTRTVQNAFMRERGYELVRTTEVRDGAGHDGRALQFHVTIAGERRGYLLALFVVPRAGSDTIRVAELVARREVFDGRRDEVLQALATLR